MIPADQLELITAAVDGELSAPERHTLQRLLAASPEARVLFEKLRADRDRVRELPQAAPPAWLLVKILARVAAEPTAPHAVSNRNSTQPAIHARPGPPAWVPAGLAASLLLGITAGSFLYFRSEAPVRGNTAAQNSWVNELPPPQDTPTAPSPVLPQPHVPQPDPLAIAHSNTPPVPPAPLPQVGPPHDVAVAPPPRAVPHDLIGSHILPPLAPFELVEAQVPFLRAVDQFDREDVRQELIAELKHDSPFRLDLFVRDTARGAEVFQNAAKSVGLTVIADAATLEKLKKGQVAALVVYSESLTAAELTALFEKLSSEDAKFSPRVCTWLHAAPAVAADEAELKQILGTDTGVFKRAAGTSSAGGAGQGGKSDPKPISAGTVDRVVETVSGSKPLAAEKTALLTTWQTTHPSIARTNPAASAELKQFLAKRSERKAGTVPVILVIRLKG
jgi:hypothetical protein